MKEYPLVSVVVVTYNSSQTILQTLESVRMQDYEKIELIISDDNSSDNTVAVCEEWINNHSNRFVKSKIITTSNNTGVTGNVNRGWRSCCGEWVKIFGGDDLFLPHAISAVMDFVTPEKSIIVSQYNSFTEENGEKKGSPVKPCV